MIKGYPVISRDMYADFGSGDHRGTPESPGRVVTVIERSFWKTLADPQSDLEPEGSIVWGAAYHIPASHADEVHAYLEDREIDGYSAHFTPFHPSTLSHHAESTTTTTPAEPMTCMVYIGLPTNPQFLRDPAQREPDAVARVISKSRGLSGANKDYLYLLQKALDGLGLAYTDAHITDLVSRVKQLEEEEEEEEEGGGWREDETTAVLEKLESATPDEFDRSVKAR
ncbi:hypothetical protein VTO42DRAFT_3471 [Malbranchea cinnamomea]